MKCPECGDEDQQRRIGELGHRPAVVYHCEACNRLYASEEGDDVDDLGGEEE
jgi:rubredoxin